MTDSNITVYRLTTHDTFGNSHACNRHETWGFVKDRIFNNITDATEYVVSQNATTTWFVTNTIYLDDVSRGVFAREFSLDDRYLHHRRWFIGRPDVSRMKKNLNLEGIIVE